MKVIKVTGSVSSLGLDPHFEAIKTIEIEDKCFAEGGFGRIYHCITVDKKKCHKPQVIKIFKDSCGSAAHSYRTIMGLLNGLKRKKEELDELEIDLIDYYPALFGAPQFVFEGELDGEYVQGYSANNLTKFGYVCFTDVLEKNDVMEKYYDISIESRTGMAYHLVRTFELLKEIRYIHADFKSDNFFVGLGDDDKCALIDYDSGSIIENLNDEPFTAGTPSQDMLAPEIRSQLHATGHAKVNLHTDVWSVAVACHYLYFLCHPFYSLSEVSDQSVSAYNAKFTWPAIDKSFKYINEDIVDYIDDLQENYTLIDNEIIKCFRYTFTSGYFNPNYRTSYSQWRMKLTPSLPEGSERKSLEWIRRHKFAPEPQKPTYTVSPENFAGYISELAIDIINHKKYLHQLKDELQKIERELNKPRLYDKTQAFITAYFDIWADGVITETERRKFMFTGKTLGVNPDVVEMLLATNPL
ncbi:MAG: serine/threonine-protein kinase [Bacteroidaceae bacterium]|nr:serine/threonine-protein kinase [Bacteroidaceae bacterium]